jgi:hypothetical protein
MSTDYMKLHGGRLLELGYHPHPLEPATKRPATYDARTGEWHGHRD